MEQDKYIEFLGIWGQVCLILTFVAIAISLLIFLVFKFRYWGTNDLKTKFDLASKLEVKVMLWTFYTLGIAAFFFLNSQKTDTVQLSFIWFFIRLFIAICAATLVGYIAYLVFKYYYPGPLSSKLERLRYSPRINPQTGNKMKLLSEAEEDAYLDEGQQAEENVFSVDYDVWIDPITGYTQIEKYQGHLTAHECDRCGFQTLRLTKEEVIEEASESWDGEMQQTFECSYCGRVKRKKVVITKKVKHDMSKGKLIENPLAYDKRLEVIKIEIFGAKGHSRVFEFENVELAKNFLEEFDLEKLYEEFEPEI